jgi:hypothetical protein
MASNYVDLRLGARTPAVGVLQKLLNRTGIGVDVDGEFGPQTQAGVMRFQRMHDLVVDGIVGRETWPRVSANAGLDLIDFIDVFDKSLFDLEAKDIAALGGDPLMIGGACNGVEQAVTMILQRAGAGNVFLLRFHGHGAPGDAGISTGHGDDDPNLVERADIALQNFGDIAPQLQRLRPIFGPYGNIQFMHCSTGRGHAGRNLLRAIAKTVGVPVTAAVFDQLGGGFTTFQYEGPTNTQFAGNETLRSWSQSRPDFAGVSVL